MALDATRQIVVFGIFAEPVDAPGPGTSVGRASLPRLGRV